MSHHVNAKKFQYIKLLIIMMFTCFHFYLLLFKKAHNMEIMIVIILLKLYIYKHIYIAVLHVHVHCRSI